MDGDEKTNKSIGNFGEGRTKDGETLKDWNVIQWFKITKQLPHRQQNRLINVSSGANCHNHHIMSNWRKITENG